MNFQGKRVLVTGASGFIGRALSRALQQQDAEVHGSICTRPAIPDIQVHPWKLRDAPAPLLDKVRPDYVFHLASPINLSRDPSLEAELNQQIFEGGKALVLACEDREIPLLVAGTCEEYGDNAAPFSEAMSPSPVSPYSQAKARLSQWTHQRCRDSTLRAVVVRPFLTYGPEQVSPRLIPTAIRAALGHSGFDATDGAQTREFNFINDMVEALLRASRPECEGKLLNLGGGEEHSIQTVVNRIYALAGADPNSVRWGALPHRAGEVKRFYGDHTTANEKLGSWPRTGLDEGLRATIDWWRSSGVLED